MKKTAYTILERAHNRLSCLQPHYLLHAARRNWTSFQSKTTGLSTPYEKQRIVSRLIRKGPSSSQVSFKHSLIAMAGKHLACHNRTYNERGKSVVTRAACSCTWAKRMGDLELEGLNQKEGKQERSSNASCMRDVREASTKIILLKLLSAKPKCARDAKEHGCSDASVVHDCLHG